ncbi:MAG TPA: response regulator transcription factor, partial [Candidatus Dormibacteraeota bacterium]|nr:response regulator transcription factor [Candidatus Dormibacteraeota bacterium]
MTSPAVAAQPIRLLIVDDQNLFRSGLASLLDDDARFDMVGEACDGIEALQEVARLQPDVVLMDLRMPRMDGLEATRLIRQNHRATKVLVLTSFEADSHVMKAIEAGADGFILKDSKPSAIAASIVAVQAGERVMAGAVADSVFRMLTGQTSEKEFYDGLTSREVQVLRQIAGGMPNKQIALQLCISEKTVRNHISNLYEKLHICDRAQAVLYA